MREIKFRAWDIKAKKMGYSPVISTNLTNVPPPSFMCTAFANGTYYSEQSAFRVYGKDRWILRWEKGEARGSDGWIKNPVEEGRVNRENGILMQYTGLKDKNGKEIYEGDIILRNQKSKYVIEWNKGAFHAEPINGGYGIILSGLAKGECEIVGNIYENPALIGGEFNG